MCQFWHKWGSCCSKNSILGSLLPLCSQKFTWINARLLSQSRNYSRIWNLEVLWYCAPSLAHSRQSVDVSFNNELVKKWVMSEWINEWVKYLSPKERKLNTALAEEAADWSQVHKPLGHFKNLNSMERTQGRSYRNLSLGGWNGSCQVWRENPKTPTVQFDCLMLCVCLVHLLICLRYNVNGIEL